ncbi:MAG: ABC transporter permease [Lachnospiraceae bacterium]|nr:ABC transporter permease [Lachnospiraceae bacterium]
MKRKPVDFLLVWIVPIAVLVLWYVCSNRNLINQSVLPSPQKVWSTLAQMIVKGTLWKHIRVSLLRVVRGYLIGAASGFLLGVFAALFRPVGRIVESPGGVLRPIPAIALIPFFILWMGIGEQSKVAVIVFGSFWPVLLNTMQGIREADSGLLEVGRVLEKNRITTLFQIILPAALPSIFTGLRLGVSSAWTCVVAAEMIAASAGIGFLITYSREMAQPASLLIGIAVIGLLGYVFDMLLRKLNDAVIFWGH